MTLGLEWKKVKRTGFVPAFLIGGNIAAAVPILNMSVRSDVYTGMDGSPVQILFSANWQMMALLNVLLIVLGACMIYHSEYADNAIEKMRALPMKESGLFFGKFVLMAMMYVVILVFEAAGTFICVSRWFTITKNVGTELVQNFCYTLLLAMPVLLTALIIASVFKNMWISLGVGVVCIFLATMLPTDNFVLSLFPFALPFQTLPGTAANIIRNFVIAGLAESVGFVVAELVILKVRRIFA